MSFGIELDLEKELYEFSLEARRKEEVQQLKIDHKEKLRNGPSAQSGKKKKHQLRARKTRLQKHNEEKNKLDDHTMDLRETVAKLNRRQEEMKLEVALGRTRKETTERELATFFVKETKEQIYLRIAEARNPLDCSKRDKPILAREIVRDPLLDHPKRPDWKYDTSKEKVENKETLAFDEWLEAIHAKYSHAELNHFEHNLEVWRQLWRVLERSTHIVLVVDIRNPLLHIPPSLYDYVTSELKKPLIIVLNKTDLMPDAAIDVWTKYLEKRFPKCQYVTFSSRSDAISTDMSINERRKILSTRLTVGNPTAMECAAKILHTCGVDSAVAESIVSDMNDYDPNQVVRGKPKKARRRKAKKELRIKQSEDCCDHCGDGAPVVSCLECSDGVEAWRMCLACDSDLHRIATRHKVIKLSGKSNEEEDPESNPTSTRSAEHVIGLVGHPNVGKSSVLNALAGKKLVSVSHTPGHTKKLQTIWISKTICLCDCPGLVFPYTAVPRFLQEVSGLYPFSQIKEPLSAMRFLAEHLDLETLLGLTAQTQEFDGIEEVIEWTPWTLCEAYAEKLKYKTDRRGRPDYHRAGVELIRDCVDGIVPLYFYPPKY